VNGNDFVKFMLRSPLQIVMGDTMLVTVKGRKTGKPITLPVNYYRDGNTLWVISNRERTWWRNVCPAAPVTLHLHGRDMKACAEMVSDEKAVAAQMADYVRHLPMSAKPLGIRMEGGIPNCDDSARAAKNRLFIKLQLD